MTQSSDTRAPSPVSEGSHDSERDRAGAPRWAGALERAVATLLADPAGLDGPVPAKALALLSEELPGERAYPAIPQATGSWLTRPEWEWTRSATTPRLGGREFKLLDRWVAALQRGECVRTTADSLAVGERTAHNLAEFSSIVITPIRAGTTLRGALLVEQVSPAPEPGGTPWTVHHVAALQTLAAALAALLARDTRSRDRDPQRERTDSRTGTRPATPSSIDRVVLDAIPTLIAWKDRELRYQGCNRSMARALGLTSPDAIVGKRDEDLAWHPERGPAGDRARAREREVIESRQASPRVRARVERAPGRAGWFEVTRLPLLDARGRSTGVVVAYDDVTTLARAEEHLRRARRLESLGTFAAGLEHNLETLSSEIDAAASRLRAAASRSGRDGEESGEETLASLDIAGRKLWALGRQLRAFAGRSLVQPTELSLPRLLESIQLQLARTLGDAASLAIEPAATRCHVTADARQLELLLVNLVAAAAEELGRDSARAAERQHQLLIGTIPARIEADDAAALGVKAGDYVALRLRSSARFREPLSGDPPGEDRAFDPYPVVDGRRRAGAGLGLEFVVAHAIVREAGGALRLRSDERSTTIEVFLPRAYKKTGSDADANAPANVATRGAETIAVISANETLRQAIASLLRTLGYRPIALAEATPAALREATSEREAIQLALVDTPGDDARSLLRTLREVAPAARLVVMTSRRESDGSASIYVEEDITWLFKPFALEALAAALRDALAPR